MAPKSNTKNRSRRIQSRVKSKSKTNNQTTRIQRIQKQTLRSQITPLLVTKNARRAQPRKSPAKQAKTKPRIRINPSQPNYVLGFITRALEQKWAQYEIALKQFQTRPTRTAVHDLRVAIRRLTAILDLIHKFIPQSNINAAEERLKDQVSGLSDLRDIQVQISTIRKISKDFPELKKFYKSLLDDEERYLKQSKEVTTPAFVNPLDSAIERIKVSLNARRGSIAPDKAQNVVEETVNNVFELVAKRLKELNPGESATIHCVRLAFKPFRYLLETFYPLLPEVEVKQVRNALWLARVMGEIQDFDVLMKNLVEYKWENADQRKAMMEIWQETEARKNETTRRFLNSLGKFSELLKPISQDQIQPIKMKAIYILRHAIAMQRGDPRYPLDSDRPLTAKGVRRMRRIAGGMRRLGVKFDLILTSPYRRALETAFIVARQFRVGETIQTTPMLTPETPPESLVEELVSKYGACRNVILVGHEPQLSAIISKLIYGNMSSPPILKKGGLCKLQTVKLGSEKAATLSWLLTPKQLVAMA